jgi:hypothetical protein
MKRTHFILLAVGLLIALGVIADIFTNPRSYGFDPHTVADVKKLWPLVLGAVLLVPFCVYAPDFLRNRFENYKQRNPHFQNHAVEQSDRAAEEIPEDRVVEAPEGLFEIDNSATNGSAEILELTPEEKQQIYVKELVRLQAEKEFGSEETPSEVEKLKLQLKIAIGEQAKKNLEAEASVLEIKKLKDQLKLIRVGCALIFFGLACCFFFSFIFIRLYLMGFLGK